MILRDFPVDAERPDPGAGSSQSARGHYWVGPPGRGQGRRPGHRRHRPQRADPRCWTGQRPSAGHGWHDDEHRGVFDRWRHQHQASGDRLDHHGPPPTTAMMATTTSTEPTTTAPTTTGAEPTTTTGPASP